MFQLRLSSSSSSKFTLSVSILILCFCFQLRLHQSILSPTAFNETFIEPSLVLSVSASKKHAFPFKVLQEVTSSCFTYLPNARAAPKQTLKLSDFQYVNCRIYGNPAFRLPAKARSKTMVVLF